MFQYNRFQSTVHSVGIFVSAHPHGRPTAGVSVFKDEFKVYFSKYAFISTHTINIVYIFTLLAGVLCAELSKAS